MMLKMSADQAKKIVGTLKTASVALRKMAAERDALLEVIARMSRENEVAQIKQAMDSKGLNPWGTDEARDVELNKIAQEGKLEVFKKAVDLSANLSVAKIGEVLADDTNTGTENKRSEQSRAELDQFVLGG